MFQNNKKPLNKGGFFFCVRIYYANALIKLGTLYPITGISAPSDFVITVTGTVSTPLSSYMLCANSGVSSRFIYS